jgi:hypothetical protein
MRSIRVSAGRAFVSHRVTEAALKLFDFGHFRPTFAQLSAPELTPLRPLCAQWKTSNKFVPNLLRYSKSSSKPSNGTLLSA